MSARPLALFNFFYAPLALMLFAIIAIPLCLLLTLGPTLAIRRALGRGFMHFAMWCIGAPIKVRGLKHLPTGPAICVSNHASYLDGLVLTAALPSNYTFVVQDGAASWPLAGFVIRRMGVSFVNRSEARSGAMQTRALLKRLKAGESLAIFAEGTFKSEPGLLPFKNGAFLMAARAGVPVLPAVIRGTRQLWGGGRKLPRWSQVKIELLAPHEPTGTEREQVQALRAAVRADILKRCGEPDLERHRSHHPHTEPEAESE